MKIKELAEKYNSYIIDRRRYYHQHPELSLKEVETTKTLIKDLEDMGIEVKTFKNVLGCVGTIKGKNSSKTVLLRADIDALPVQEKTNLPFASQNGNMHACGHDNHMAMLLGAAKILTELKDELNGNVKIYFQSGEEVAQGAKLSIEEGLMEDVDACYGVHIWSTLDSPLVDFSYGERMASCDTFKIIVEADENSNKAKDAILATSGIIVALQSIVSRINDPNNSTVVTIGTINGGNSYDTVAKKVEIEGTVRTFNPQFRMKIETLIREISQDTAKSYGALANLEYFYLTGPVINDNTRLVDLARNSVKKLYGEEGLGEIPKMTGSEDFAYLMEKAPGVFGFVGARNPLVPGSEKNNHHECFTPDEEVLKRGAGIAAQFAYDFLNLEK